MRNSLIITSTLAMTIVGFAAPAQAGCQGTTCSTPVAYSNGADMSRHYQTAQPQSFEYSSYSNSTSTMTAPCPTGSSRTADGFCQTSHRYAASPILDQSYGPITYNSGENSGQYTSYSTMAEMPAESPSMVPYTTSVSEFSIQGPAGLGASEGLVKTNCPTNVYNPEGAQVLGCYSIATPAPVIQAPVIQAPVIQAPVVRTQTQYNTVRVVRPIVYVRYPVPTPVPMAPAPRPMPMPVPMPMPIQGPSCGAIIPIVFSRYGNNAPSFGGCGW